MDSLDQFSNTINFAFKELRERFEEVSTSIQESVSILRSRIEAVVVPAIQQFAVSLQDQAKGAEKILFQIGENGWYVDLQMYIPELMSIVEPLSDGNVTEFEKKMVDYFERKLDDIEQSIISKYPNREKIIKAGFDAHRNHNYELSIPVLFSQTDGICKEAINVYFFSHDKKQPKTADYVKQVTTNMFISVLLTPLIESHPVRLPEKKRTIGFHELNRHMVLHGESLDYGNKINSLKAISLINYISHILPIKPKMP